MGKHKKSDGAASAAPLAAASAAEDSGAAQEKQTLLDLLRASSKRGRGQNTQIDTQSPEKKKTKAEASSPAISSVPDRQPDTWPDTLQVRGRPVNPGLCPVDPGAPQPESAIKHGELDGSQPKTPADTGMHASPGNLGHCPMTPAETGSPVDSGSLGLCPMTPASDSQPATPASSCNTSHTQQSSVPGQKRAMNRQEYTKWRMNYLRARENKNPKNRMSPTCLAALKAGEDLFDIFVACKGEWAQVHIHREMTTRQRRGSRDCDAKMNKDQLLAHYCGNAELTDAIIAEEASLGEC